VEALWCARGSRPYLVSASSSTRPDTPFEPFLLPSSTLHSNHSFPRRHSIRSISSPHPHSIRTRTIPSPLIDTTLEPFLLPSIRTICSPLFKTSAYIPAATNLTTYCTWAHLRMTSIPTTLRYLCCDAAHIEIFASSSSLFIPNPPTPRGIITTGMQNSLCHLWGCESAPRSLSPSTSTFSTKELPLFPALSAILTVARQLIYTLSAAEQSPPPASSSLLTAPARSRPAPSTFPSVSHLPLPQPFVQWNFLPLAIRHRITLSLQRLFWPDCVPQFSHRTVRNAIHFRRMLGRRVSLRSWVF
jgi:hypothetical protein